MTVRMSAAWTEAPTKVIHLILKNSSKPRPAFSRHLNLRSFFPTPSHSPGGRGRYKRSQNLQGSHARRLTQVQTGPGERESVSATESPSLNFSPAGRLTRSEESWKLQLKNIEDGHSFLVDAKLEGKAIGAMYFLRCG